MKTPSTGLCPVEVDDIALPLRASDPVSAIRPPRSTLARRLRFKSRRLPVSTTRLSLLYRRSCIAAPPVPAPDRTGKSTGDGGSRVGMWYVITGEPREEDSEGGGTDG